MDGFIIGFLAGLGWIPFVLVAWLIRSAFSISLDLGEG